MTTESTPSVTVPLKWGRLGTLGATEAEFTDFFSITSLIAAGDRLSDDASLDEFDMTGVGGALDIGGGTPYWRYWGIRVKSVIEAGEAYQLAHGEAATVSIGVSFRYVGPGTADRKCRVVGAALAVADDTNPADYGITDANYPIGDGPGGAAARPAIPLWTVLPDWDGVASPNANHFQEGFAWRTDEQGPMTTGTEYSVGGLYVHRTLNVYYAELLQGPPYPGTGALFPDPDPIPDFPDNTWIVLGFNGTQDDLADMRIAAYQRFESFTTPGSTRSESMSALSAPAGTRRRKGIG